MKYRTSYTGKRRETVLGLIRSTLGEATRDAHAILNNARAPRFVSILRDSEGADHPDNAGKFMLHQICRG